MVSQDVIPSRSQFATLNEKTAKDKGKIESLRSQIMTSKKDGRGSNFKYFPYVFTEQGVAMLSSVLKSERAIEMNIIIMRAFIKIRNLIYSNKDLAERMEKIERSHNKHSQQIGRIFETLDKLAKIENNNKIEIGFKG